MGCGAATGRLGFFLDWLEAHKKEEKSAVKEIPATTTEYYYRRNRSTLYKIQYAETESKGVVVVWEARR